MNYFQRKKQFFMSIVNQIKGFVRNISGVPPLTLEDCVDENSVINYQIYGNSVQDGEPAPDNPIEVESVGEYDEESGKYKIPITASGKNLITQWNFGWIPYNTGIVSKRDDRKYTDYIKIEKGISYVLSGGSTNINYTLYDENYNYIKGNIKGNRYSLAFYSDVAEYIRIANPNTNIDNIQFEKGEAFTFYEPYYKPIITNIYLDEPLSNTDYIDYKNGLLVRDRDIPTEEKISLPNLPAFKGTTIYTVDTTIQPSNMEVEYYSTVKGE